MNPRDRKNDIQIGESRWIEFENIEDRYLEAVQVDQYLVELLPLWQALEQHCIAECCGFDAFDFYPETIFAAAAEMDSASLRQSLDRSIQAIESLDTTVVASPRLNDLADKRTFIALLSHVKSSLPPA
jgi:hypothetical protein